MAERETTGPLTFCACCKCRAIIFIPTISFKMAASQRSVSPLHHEPCGRQVSACRRQRGEPYFFRKVEIHIAESTSRVRVVSSVTGGCDGVSFRCDAAQPLDSSGLLKRVGLDAVIATCVAACVDAEALAHLVAQPITFCAGRRSSWSISTRRSPCISASGFRNDLRYWNDVALLLFASCIA